MIGVGICGWGYMGQTHAANLGVHPEAELLAVADPDPARRNPRTTTSSGNLPVAASSHRISAGVRFEESADALIADPRIHLLIIAAPTPLHAGLSIAALRAGKHVLCEKPMALSSAECRPMIAAAETSRGYLMIGHCVRFWPQYAEIRGRVMSGDYGAIRSVMLRRVCPPPEYSLGGWLLDHTRSGGAILDLHVHDADYALHLMGPPQRVTASGVRGPSGGIDHVASVWHYPDGRIVTFEGGWCYPRGYAFEMYVNVRCERATFEWCFGRDTEVRMYAEGGEVAGIPAADSDGWREELAYFLDCVRQRRPPEAVTPRSAAEAVRMIELERESITCGGTVAASL